MKKKKQEDLRRENKQKQVLRDAKHIFVDAFDIQNYEEGAPIINQLVNIVEKVTTRNMESYEKLMDQLARRFETMVVYKVSITIAKKKVLLQEKEQVMIELIQKEQHFYTIFSDA